MRSKVDFSHEVVAMEELEYRDPQDDKTLTARTGKKPVLKVRILHRWFPKGMFHANLIQRNFGFMSILGFGTLVLSTWIGAFLYEHLLPTKACMGLC